MRPVPIADNHWRSVSEYVGMLVVLTAQPDAESAMDGIHRLLHQIDDHATAVGEHWEAAWAALPKGAALVRTAAADSNAIRAE